ncbi:MAG: hypothetical protein GDA50_03830 [Alphaproteobacteria bacterium GM202ARS2]|nr:hypothetical protein [Alphaproteobacteria bacterium GM202ARS2]
MTHPLSSLFTQHIDGRTSKSQHAHLEQRVAEQIDRLHHIVDEGEAEGTFLRGIDEATWDSLVRYANTLRKRHKRIVVFGAGAALSCGRIYSSITYPHSRGNVGQKDGVTFCLCDSLDPQVLDVACGQEETPPCCVFLSRSGDTLETREQLHFCLQRYGGNKDNVSCPIVMILGKSGQQGGGLLRAWAQDHNVDIIDFDESLSGRFSPLGVVGIMVGLLAGADMAQVRAYQQKKGALKVGEKDAISDSVLWHEHWAERGRTTSVLMVYQESLWGLACWYRQLWAESLGKDGKGLTPFIALGPQDQHSQLQLWLDGPEDKTYTLMGRVAGAKHARGLHVQHACRVGTQNSLRAKQLPLRVVDCYDSSEALAAALARQWMAEVYVLCRLWSIDPFNQPAVAQGKDTTESMIDGFLS